MPESGYGDLIKVAIQNDGSGTLSLYVDGTLAGYTTINKESDYGTDKLVNNFTFGARNGGGNKSNIQLYDAVLSKGLAYIPEPSAFGLLAGVGALALVASRRRRR